MHHSRKRPHSPDRYRDQVLKVSLVHLFGMWTSVGFFVVVQRRRISVWYQGREHVVEEDPEIESQLRALAERLRQRPELNADFQHICTLARLQLPIAPLVKSIIERLTSTSRPPPPPQAVFAPPPPRVVFTQPPPQAVFAPPAAVTVPVFYAAPPVPVFVGAPQPQQQPPPSPPTPIVVPTLPSGITPDQFLSMFSSVFQAPKVGFTDEYLKWRDESVIHALYDPAAKQCSLCGLRLPNADAFDKHQDWHFAQRKKDTRRVTQTVSRGWGASSDEWGSDGQQAAQSDSSKAAADAVDVLADAHEETGTETSCAACHDLIPSQWSSESEAWVLPRCVRLPSTVNASETKSPWDKALRATFAAHHDALSAYADRLVHQTCLAAMVHAQCKFDVGQQVQALWDKDGMWYDGEIKAVDHEMQKLDVHMHVTGRVMTFDVKNVRRAV